jgi:hypothetical protein
MDEEKDTDLSTIDNKESMVKFMEAIRERAKDLPPNCAENTKPDVAAKALWLLAQGANFTEIRRITSLSNETIRRLEWVHTDTLEQKRKQFSTRYAMAAMEYTDLLFKKAEQLWDDPEQLAMVSPEKLATTVGIMQDKASALAGISSTDISKKDGLSIEDALVLIEASRKKIAEKAQNKVIEAEVIHA